MRNLWSVLGKLLYESNILHITSYFNKEVTYYSYILLNQKSNLVIILLLLLSKVIILCNLVTELPSKSTYEHVCRTPFLPRKQEFYEE